MSLNNRLDRAALCGNPAQSELRLFVVRIERGSLGKRFFGRIERRTGPAEPDPGFKGIGVLGDYLSKDSLGCALVARLGSCYSSLYLVVQDNPLNLLFA